MTDVEGPRQVEGLKLRVENVVTRVRAEKATPKEARADIAKLKAEIEALETAPELVELVRQLTALIPLLDAQAALAKASRAADLEEAKATKEHLVAEAEKIGAGNDWRNGANRLRELLDAWKVVPRLDRATDDALWHRFSTARTHYTRRRKAHFGEVKERSASATATKERLIAEAEALATSTDWGRTSTAYRDLMAQWKQAGSAGKSEDDKLWERFRAAQDVFFNARTAADKEADEAKAAAKKARDADRAAFNEAKKAADAEWQRTDPEKSARADGMIAQLEAGIAAVEAKIAAGKGDPKKLADELESKKAFLEITRRAYAEFTA